MKKINSRTKRLLRNRSKLKKVNVDRYRIAVFKSLKNISAQIIDDKINKTIVSASSMEKDLKKDKKNKVFFKYKKDMIYFNLTKFIKSQLKSIKITNIDTINIDTFNTKNNFFSSRQSLRLKHDDYGRNISIIMIN